MIVARHRSIGQLIGTWLMVCFALLVPAVSGHAQSLPIRINGIVPEMIKPGGQVRIVLSESIFVRLLKENPPGPVMRGISVQIGGRLAQVTDVAVDTIVVEAPANLPRGDRVEIKVLGWGVSASAFAHVEQFSLADFFGDNPLATYSGGAVLFLAALGGVLQLRRTRLQATVREVEFREAELKHELDKLKLREEQRQAEPVLAEPATRPVSDDKNLGPPTSPLVPDVPRDLIESIARGECTLFWGAGVSAQAGYPTWLQLLGDIVEGPATEEDPALRSMLQRALEARQTALVIETLVTRLGPPRVAELTRRHLQAVPKSADVLERLAAMPFANAVTSTWDRLIDATFERRRPEIVTGVSSGGLENLLTRKKFCLVRLWGSLDRPETVLFTSDAWRAAASGNQEYAKYVTSLALDQTHFFLGASLETIEMYLSGTRGLPKSRKHYALVPEELNIALSREVFRDHYGVELLVYRPTPGWPELTGFVEALKRGVDLAQPTTPSPSIEPFRLTKIRLKNIGPFESCELELDPSWTVLLGNNGSGKSTVLRAIALVLCGDDPQALAAGGQMLRVGHDRGMIELQVGATTYVTNLERADGRVIVTARRLAPLKEGRWVALAFPPLRGASMGEPKGPTNAGASKPQVGDVLPILTGQIDTRMSSLKQWLVNLDVASEVGAGVDAETAARNRRLRDHFFAVFNAFVPGMNVRFSHVDRASWRVYVKVDETVIGLDQVSQGTSSALGWVGALLQRMYEIHGADSDIGEIGALVLVDELDAHLHPEWQQRIALTLEEQFRNVQFVATTHSPLIVGELKRQQVYRVRMVDGQVVARHPTEDLRGMGVANVLSGEAFGMERLIDRETHELLEKQRLLSLAAELTRDKKAELADVNGKLGKLGFKYEARDPLMREFLKWRAQRLTPAPSGADLPPPNAHIDSLIAEAAREVADRDRS